MKKLFITALLVVVNWNTIVFAQNKTTASVVKATIDLNTIEDDRVKVIMSPTKINKDEVVFQIPKTVPGTYSADNYGKYIDELKAFDSNKKELKVEKTDENTWKISNAKTLSQIVYFVNDTYDTETGRGFGKEEVFSPAGSNILKGKNFMLNNHCFIGYFDGNPDVKYSVTINHPADLVGTTSLTDADKSNTVDVFNVDRYFDLTDNPIMYCKPNFETFTVDGMEILFSVYSPNGVHTAKSLLPDLEKMMRAQKAFLGSINDNKKYTVLLYLSESNKRDAKGFGALEHHTCTTVVFPEAMPSDMLGKQIIDVVSHEFFHIVTPLSIHSKEIQYFDYNDPKMSKHLWMYEGVTEYFANLFQINQGLIDEDEFYQRMLGKISNASRMNDTMSFTEMSQNVLVKPYKDQYLNVYEKGALIGMCIDVIIREKSNGERGILDLMKKLSKEYGVSKPFNDDELFAKITSLTYPEVGAFLNTHVAGTTPINYDDYFEKMGVGKGKSSVPANPFLKDQTPYITVNPSTKEIALVSNMELNDFFKNLNMKAGDIILAINNVDYNLDNIYDMVMESQNWNQGDAISIKMKRDGNVETINGKVKLTMEEVETYKLLDESKQKLNNAWLKG
ncbi:M61 family metallopeptidase [Flavobacterium capsici]|uniref:Peptidase M61 n=1 Tax=Flavobacterium capsici TaxID=3075618 RepID=A0AA96F0C4_9FLAO|nr:MULTISPECIES: peptidase M61 [unclassified Flavobacterium]WNM20297.1 peptidase M61 [Flavobacterium sp. PMR2A8]WNM21687.1 peptidase M61 [Flavobacterium sp. PMTSA4]